MTDLEKEDIARIASLAYSWDKLKYKTVLISGGTGFIGRQIIRTLQYRNEIYSDKIKIISLSRHSVRVNDKNVIYLCHNICNSVQIDEPIDFILHLASNTHPKQYGENPIGTIIDNVYGCNNLLRLATSKSARFLLASSVEIYGEGNGSPMNESYCGILDCNTVRAGYNEAKRISESLCQAYRKQHSTDIVIARLARCFGADTKDDSKAIAQFFNKVVTGENIIMNSHGNQRFSYCYIADAAGAILKILIDGESGEAYNIAADDEGKTLGEYAKIIAQLGNKSVEYKILNNENVSKAQFAVLNCDKLHDIGWTPQYTVSDGLNRTYNILVERNKK